MEQRRGKIAVILFCAALCAEVFSGCGSKNPGGESSASGGASSETSAEESSAAAGKQTDAY